MVMNTIDTNRVNSIHSSMSYHVVPYAGLLMRIENPTISAAIDQSGIGPPLGRAPFFPR